jgi:hypothetical protein
VSVLFLHLCLALSFLFGLAITADNLLKVPVLEDFRTIFFVF